MSKYNLTDLISENKMQLTEGTRAMVAYLDGDKLITTYNHYDGYPSNLGKGLEAHYNDDKKAREVANRGYITYLDPETGDIDATHNDPARKIKLPSEDEDMARAIAGEIDNMFADYGYIWDDRADKWVVIKNTGIRSMIDQIMKEMGDYGMDEIKEQDDANGYVDELQEVTMANVNVDEVKFHLDAYEKGVIDGDDLHQAISEIFFGKVVAPGMKEDTAMSGAVADELEAGAIGDRVAEEESIKEEIGPTGIAISQKQLDDLEKLGAISGLKVIVQDKDGSNVRKVDYTLTNTNYEKDPDDIDFVNEDLKNHFGRFMKDYQ